ncbi:MAG: teicoplanin resistance protein VanZ [Ignavibacteriales bacterium]|nr:teicoplanin resistance protein VanZ [Ignavibacteriales bacterium]
MANFRNRAVFATLAAYWSALLVATSLPQSAAPELVFSDKLVHFGAYAGLSALLSLALAYQRKWRRLATSPLAWAAAIAILYGAFDELHQAFIPGRSCEFLDLVADALGAGVGAAIGAALLRLKFFRTDGEHFRDPSV